MNAKEFAVQLLPKLDEKEKAHLLRCVKESLEGKSVSLHFHRCGFPVQDSARTMEPFGPGCGHIWLHTKEETNAMNDEEYSHAHDCPKCGSGPWTLKYRQDTIEELGDL